MKLYSFNESHRKVIGDLISGVSLESWKAELDRAASKYHVTVLWVAIIFDPLFAISDYFNIPGNWQKMLVIRFTVSFITLILLSLRKKIKLPSYFVAAVAFFMISLQNSYAYSLIGAEDILGHNLNYMALLIGASMFVLWQWTFSVIMVVISALTTAVFLSLNPDITTSEFLVKGGFLLGASAVFMIVLIRTRYNLTVKEIKLRIALQASNEEIQAQAEEIRGINENLENMVVERTQELEKKNKALEEYAFINAHKLRSPVASILGLINLLNKTELNPEGKNIMGHLHDSTTKLDSIVTSITKAIERGEKK